MSGRGETWAFPTTKSPGPATGLVTSAPPAERATLTAGGLVGSAGHGTPGEATSGAGKGPGHEFQPHRASRRCLPPAVSVDVTPDWKPEKRKKATTKQWKVIRGGLNELCLVCGDPAQSAHHIVRKAQGGDDVPANLAALCGHGTRGCHGLVEARHRPTLSTLRYALSDDQLDYVLKKKGQAWFDRAYPKPDCVVCDDLGCSHCPSVPKEAA